MSWAQRFRRVFNIGSAVVADNANRERVSGSSLVNASACIERRFGAVVVFGFVAVNNLRTATIPAMSASTWSARYYLLAPGRNLVTGARMRFSARFSP